MIINTSEKQLLAKLLAYHVANPDKAFSSLLTSFAIESAGKLINAGIPASGVESFLCKGIIGNHSQFRQWLVGPDGSKGANEHPDFKGQFAWAKGTSARPLSDDAAAALQAALTAL